MAMMMMMMMMMIGDVGHMSYISIVCCFCGTRRRFAPGLALEPRSESREVLEVLHREVFARRSFYPQRPLLPLHIGAFAEVFTHKVCPHRSLCTPELSHAIFPHRRFYTHML